MFIMTITPFLHFATISPQSSHSLLYPDTRISLRSGRTCQRLDNARIWSTSLADSALEYRSAQRALRML